MKNTPQKNQYLKNYRANLKNKEAHMLRMRLRRTGTVVLKPKQVSISQKEKYRLLRLKCLKYYGDKCACCGETEPKFLALDHINGGGTKHRKGKGNIIQWIATNKYPPLFQVLCHNCNSAKGFYGYCPHKVIAT